MNPFTIDRLPEGYRTLPGKLHAANVTVPAEYTDALAAAEWFPTVPSTRDAYETLYAAETPEAFSVASAELARAHAEVEAFRNDDFIRDLRDFRVGKVAAVFNGIRGDLFADIADRYNEHADEFADSASRLPDLTTIKPLDLTTDHASAIGTAKAVASVLDKAWTAYRAVAALSGEPIVNAKELEDAYTMAEVLGEYATTRDFGNAAQLIRQHANGNDTGGVLALSPHYAVAYYGRLHMLPPRQAGERRTALQWAEVAAERTESPFAYPGVPGGAGKPPSVEDHGPTTVLMTV